MPESTVSVLHCFRAPIGGLFRHVRDLVRKQNEQGLKVGVICDSTTESPYATSVLDELAYECDLEVVRMPIARPIGPADFSAIRRITEIARRVSPDVIHGHGAKGGAYARLIARRIGAISVYTPHGGSLHYSSTSVIGLIYFNVERLLRPLTQGIIFESQYAAGTYQHKVGLARCPTVMIHNGLYESEFEAVATEDDCHDFVCIGELRKLKGLEILLEATSMVRASRPVKLAIVGAGPDESYFKRLLKDYGLEASVTFSPPIYPIAKALAMGRCVAMPSLAESLPYIVLETIAARRPLLATSVGGIPEIVGPYTGSLVPPNDARALADAMTRFLDNPDDAEQLSNRRAEYVKDNFDVDVMASKILEFYQHLLRSTGINR